MPVKEAIALQTALYRKVLRLMGNRFEISVVWKDEAEAMQKIEKAVAEIQRIEKLLTTYNEESQTSLVNRNAGIRPVQVDREMFELVKRSLRISALTQGAFDITYGSVDKRLWNFDKTMTALPDAETARKSVHLINYKNVILDEASSSIFLAKEGMRIGFGGIGKGYAAERAKAVLIAEGVSSGIVNAAGDLTAWGYQPDGKEWTIGIADPNAARSPFSYMSVSNMAVATSGNYEKYIQIDGKKYSHTIDPKTGLPVSGIKSVTIICPNAEIADAMATPVTIMGITAGLNMINQVKGIGCIVIDDNDKVFTSKNIHLT
ncbi:MAG: FAD:protein FMN transferase [Chitinophagaceae bacterium]|nr:FAD:protein FMN transferase [Chitinophagaceae bacterium]